jgi:hypothetical protein
MMSKYYSRLSASFFIVMSTALHLHAQEPNFPVPEGNPNQLFYLQRTPNANTIVYELNYKNGQLNTDEPVHVFWIRYGEKGQKAELSAIQRSFAYGIKSSMLTPDNYELRFISYKRAVMNLKKGANNKYQVYATINQKPAILVRVYLKINGGSFWSPNIEYAELKGVDPEKGTEVAKKINIKP